MKSTTQLVKTLHNSFFTRVHQHNLIYNTCWEDPRIDRQLLQLKQESRVVMITSAGCNALDYLLDSPAAIYAVDMNPRQNALLQLKMAMIDFGSFEDLFTMFGNGVHQAYQELYAALRQCLPDYARMYWDKKIHYFSEETMKKSFYYYGTTGNLAWMLIQYLLQIKKNIRISIDDLFEAMTLEDQRHLYRRIESELWTLFMCWLVKHPVFMTMLGVPRAQIQLIQTQYPGGIPAYIRNKLRHVFTEVLIKENYFWRVYVTGSYTRDCCPNYLKYEYFDALRQNIHRISTYTSSLTQFLKAHPGTYSHFVLLDHQDWLAEHHVDLLVEEWQQILQCSRAGTKILLRSASEQLYFLPSEIKASLRFFPELTTRLHREDRVGVYGSVHLAEVV